MNDEMDDHENRRVKKKEGGIYLTTTNWHSYEEWKGSVFPCIREAKELGWPATPNPNHSRPVDMQVDREDNSAFRQTESVQDQPNMCVPHSSSPCIYINVVSSRRTSTSQPFHPLLPHLPPLSSSLSSILPFPLPSSLFLISISPLPKEGKRGCDAMRSPQAEAGWECDVGTAQSNQLRFVCVHIYSLIRLSRANIALCLVHSINRRKREAAMAGFIASRWSFKGMYPIVHIDCNDSRRCSKGEISR